MYNKQTLLEAFYTLDIYSQLTIFNSFTDCNETIKRHDNNLTAIIFYNNSYSLSQIVDVYFNKQSFDFFSILQNSAENNTYKLTDKYITYNVITHELFSYINEVELCKSLDVLDDFIKHIENYADINLQSYSFITKQISKQLNDILKKL